MSIVGYTVNLEDEPEPLLAAKGVVKYFPVRPGMFGKTHGVVKAVDLIDLSITEGENLALVGESGCGKTTLGLMLCGLIEPTAGTIESLGNPIEEISRLELARRVQPIFQDPYSALNPRETVSKTLSLPFKIFKIPHNQDTLCELLEQVGLTPARSFLDRYPHEMSGGQRQRVVIARALALKPRIIIADEPIAGLDVTVQTQILSLMKKIQEIHKTTYMIITHDISLVTKICKNIFVMYLGKIVEYGSTEQVINKPIHPYTISLLRSFPSGDPDRREWIDSPPVAGDIPSPINPPSGCRFRTRCPLAQEECALNEPPLLTCGSNHHAACPVVLGGWSSTRGKELVT